MRPRRLERAIDDDRPAQRHDAGALGLCAEREVIALAREIDAAVAVDPFHFGVHDQTSGEHRAILGDEIGYDAADLRVRVAA